ncbi:MAG: ATP-dependent helicase HrpB [Bacteroidales bacterium]
MKNAIKNTNLPILDIADECLKHLKRQNTLIVNAPPGAGKSTILPLIFMDEQWLEGKKIIVLEPRRLAAKTIAKRMSDLLNSELGKEVGYRIRFETKVSSETKIEVVTEGILTRMLQSDNALEDIGLIFFDEFHERSLHADLALALCRETQNLIRSDLRMIIMSATLDSPALEKLLNSKSVKSEGRQFPVDVFYGENSDIRLLPELTANIVIKAVKEQSGDILVFLPGEAEIKRTEAILFKKLPQIKIHALYGRLPFNRQYAAIMPDANNKRKIVLATPIAETSLTIEGISCVVDSGYCREPKFDPRSGLTRLETVLISKDSADQRAGRAGRLEAGVCYRMWTTATHMRMKDHRNPEILEADLTSLCLEVAKWGNPDITSMCWLDKPQKAHIIQAQNTLDLIDATTDGKITEHGKEIQKLPCHPRIAHMLLMAEEEDLLPLATDIAAILEEKDPLSAEEGININLRVKALREYRKEKGKLKRFQRIEQVAASYRKLFNIEAENGSFNEYDSGIILVFTYPERIAHSRPGNNAQFKMANGHLAMASHQDDMAFEQWLAIAQVQEREKIGKIFLAAPLNPRDLAPFVKDYEHIEWNTKKGGLICDKEIRIGNIVLQKIALPNPDTEKVQNCILKAIAKEGEVLLNFDKQFTQLQNRILSMKQWFPEQNWPAMQNQDLLQNASTWILPYIDDIRKPEDLKDLDLSKIIYHALDFNLQSDLQKFAPEHIQVPSGSKIKLEYQKDGKAPILAVRIQELFGLEETPSINNGKIKILIHLLSPGFRPIQITNDLKSFWANTYFEVRKELRIKYAKHYWPENPLEAEATNKCKRKK